MTCKKRKYHYANKAYPHINSEFFFFFLKQLSENMSSHEIHAVSLWPCRPQLCLISYWCRLVLLCHCYQMMAPNATVPRTWLGNKAVPFLLQSLWSRPPGCVNSLASAHWKGRKGWGHGCNQWEHLRFSDEPVLHCARGRLRAQLVSLAQSQLNKRGTGTMVRKKQQKVRLQESTHGGENWSHF